MTRKALSGLLISLLIISLAAPAYCDDPIKKLGRGICNVATCPLEVIEQMKRVNGTDGAFAAMTWGVLKGVAMTGLRAIVGVYEIATFPIPLPAQYKPILKDPEFFFEDFNF